MRALIRRKAQLVLDEAPEPVAGPGQTLVKSLVCGICGSDLHQVHHLAHVAEAGKRSGLGFAAKSSNTARATGLL